MKLTNDRHETELLVFFEVVSGSALSSCNYDTPVLGFLLSKSNLRFSVISQEDSQQNDRYDVDSGDNSGKSFDFNVILKLTHINIVPDIFMGASYSQFLCKVIIMHYWS